MTNIEHRTYSRDMDVRAAALSTASGQVLVLHREWDFFAFVPLRDVREGVDLNVSVVRDVVHNAEVWFESNADRAIHTESARPPLRMFLGWLHEPVLVLHGEGDAEDVLRNLLVHGDRFPGGTPRSVLDTLRGAPDLDDVEFSREAEDRVLDLTEDA